jgi:hypothetical protein
MEIETKKSIQTRGSWKLGVEKSIHESSRRKYLGCGKLRKICIISTQVAESRQKKSIWVLDIRQRYNKYSGYRIQKDSRRKVFGL